MNFNLRNLSLLFTAIVISFSACKKDNDDKDQVDEHAALKQEIKENYANIVYQNYKDSYDAAVELQTALSALVSNPSASTLEDAKFAWLDAREPYGQTEAFRFANGPIDDEDGPEGAINAWPLDEGYVDYVTGNASSGIINDTTITIDAATLESLNEQGGETNISLGFHAIEFLLWGQDDPNTALETPGQRPYTDYVTDGTGTASNQARRGQYLNVAADILVGHLAEMVAEWDPSVSGNYRSTFLDLDNDEALSNILTALGVLSKGELAGERINVAYDNQDQEDEHSCFSDNTHRDIILNAKGIENVYTGIYDGTTYVSGASISSLVALIDEELDQEIIDILTINALYTSTIYVPFDHALTMTSERSRIRTTVLSLSEQGDKFVEVAAALGLNISNELPE